MALTREDEVLVGDSPVFEGPTTWSDWAFSRRYFVRPCARRRCRTLAVVTGNPGVRQASAAVAAELARRGFMAIDPDCDPELSHWDTAGASTAWTVRRSRAKSGFAPSAGLERASPPRAAHDQRNAGVRVWDRRQQDGILDLFTMVFLLRIDARAKKVASPHTEARPPGRDEAERGKSGRGAQYSSPRRCGWAQPRLWHPAGAGRRGPNTRAPPGFIRRLPLEEPLDSRLGGPSTPELGRPRRSLGSARAPDFRPGRRRRQNSNERLPCSAINFPAILRSHVGFRPVSPSGARTISTRGRSKQARPIGACA